MSDLIDFLADFSDPPSQPLTSCPSSGAWVWSDNMLALDDIASGSIPAVTISSSPATAATNTVSGLGSPRSLRVKIEPFPTDSLSSCLARTNSGTTFWSPTNESTAGTVLKLGDPFLTSPPNNFDFSSIPTSPSTSPSPQTSPGDDGSPIPSRSGCLDLSALRPPPMTSLLPRDRDVDCPPDLASDDSDGDSSSGENDTDIRLDMSPKREPDPFSVREIPKQFRVVPTPTLPLAALTYSPQKNTRRSTRKRKLSSRLKGTLLNPPSRRRFPLRPLVDTNDSPPQSRSQIRIRVETGFYESIRFILTDDQNDASVETIDVIKSEVGETLNIVKCEAGETPNVAIGVSSVPVHSSAVFNANHEDFPSEKRLRIENGPFKPVDTSPIYPGMVLALASEDSSSEDDFEDVLLNGNRSNVQDGVHACTLCEKTFTRRGHLAVHIRAHSGIKPHACYWPGCGSRFGQKSHLNRHRKIHLDIRNYVCHCGARFIQRGNLMTHQRTHRNQSRSLEEKHFACALCQRRFSRRNGVTRHLQSIHTRWWSENGLSDTAIMCGVVDRRIRPPVRAPLSNDSLTRSRRDVRYLRKKLLSANGVASPGKLESY